MFCLYCEYEDGSEAYYLGADEEDCMWKATQKDGLCYYTGVNGEHDGHYYYDGELEEN